MSKVHIAKRDIDKAKRAKAAEKRQRRQSGGTPATSEQAAVTAVRATGNNGFLSDRELLARVEAAHAQLESGAIDHEQFDEIKADLLSRLQID
jgi:hypothetical protein